MAKKKQVWITCDGAKDEYLLWEFKPEWDEETGEWSEEGVLNSIFDMCKVDANTFLKIPAHVKRGGGKAIAKMDLSGIVFEKVK